MDNLSGTMLLNGTKSIPTFILLPWGESPVLPLVNPLWWPTGILTWFHVLPLEARKYLSIEKPKVVFLKNLSYIAHICIL